MNIWEKYNRILREEKPGAEYTAGKAAGTPPTTARLLPGLIPVGVYKDGVLVAVLYAGHPGMNEKEQLQHFRQEVKNKL